MDVGLQELAGGYGWHNISEMDSHAESGYAMEAADGEEKKLEIGTAPPHC
ncbi:MAG: hypothetical protein HFH89_05525 [Lachnospiraceae bacterium]|nr:hypothetical protein [uncultured Acetatifactor sp.]MCI8287111.1 hypothetical protein [Lachnospiraceae bacterium]